MSETLWNLNNQMIAIDSLLSDNTDPETQEILESAKEQLGKDIESKMENILGYIAECKSRVAFLKSEEDRIATKRKAIERRIDWLRDMVRGQLIATGRQKAEYGTWTATLFKTPDKVVVMAGMDEKIPDNLCKITRSPDKKLIKDAMGGSKELKIIDGDQEILVATIESGTTSVRIA